MKKDFKKNKRYSRLVRKLPAILKKEEKFRRELSSGNLNKKNSMRSLHKSSRDRSFENKTTL